MKTKDLRVQLKTSAPGIDDTIHDVLTSIVRVELLRVLAHHDLVERQEHRPYKSNLKSHFELESSEDQ
jgi:hypothetical protein